MNLCQAAENNNIEEVRRLLSEGVDVDAKIESEKRESGWNPLHIAAYGGYTEIVTLLITSGANLDYKDKDGYTPLHKTVWSGRMKEATILLDSGANPNVKDNWGRTPLHLAASRGKKQFVDLFIAKSGVDLNLLIAASMGMDDIVKLLINNRENVNTKDLADGSTPLHNALKNGHENIAKLLIAEGADINASDRDGTEPLHLAVMKGFLKVAELLIAKGADVNCHNEDLTSPLHYAALYGHKETVKLLIAKGADVNSMDRKGNKPLDFASSKTDVASVLLKYGARK
jgi:ankyrin repeat protein